MTAESSSGANRTSHKANWNKLERDGVRQRLIFELARGGKPLSWVARDFGCAPSSLHEFKQRHADEIEAERGKALDDLSDMWIASKKWRIQAYMANANLAEQELAKLRDVYGELPVASEEAARWLKAYDRALRSVAEELGALPSRVQIRVTDDRAPHIIEGVDVDKL